MISIQDDFTRILAFSRSMANAIVNYGLGTPSMFRLEFDPSFIIKIILSFLLIFIQLMLILNVFPIHELFIKQ